MSTAQKLPFQFTLRQLLGAMAFVSVAAASFYWFDPSIASLVVIFLVFLGIAFLFAYRRQFARAEVIVACLLGVVMVVLLLPNIQGARVTHRWGYCKHNLRTIALALQNYQDTYNSFPPAYIADTDGNPMHSWRVLLLPYLDERNLYKQYRFDEPWDGPNNSQLHGTIVRAYVCPSEVARLPTTSYLAIVGLETIWPGTTTTKMSDIKDGPANTILVVEAHNTGIHWMEPRDLDFATLSTLSSTHHHGRHNFTNVVFADDHHQALPDNTPTKTLRAAITISGQEKTKLPTVRLRQ